MPRSKFLAAAATTAALALAPSLASAAETPYDLRTKTGTIYGTLWVPSGIAKPPVVLIIAGSGPVDRNGNEVTGLDTNMYLLLAEALASLGCASVRYDKRGVFASFAAGPSEAALRFDDYVADAEAWVSKLRADGGFGNIAIVGHSEGSLVGMVAAQRAPLDAFVSLEGPGYPLYDVLRTQLKSKLTPTLAAANTRILDSLLAGRTTSAVPKELMSLYRPSVQPFLISEFRYDPRVEVAKVHVPVTIVQGTSDLQVTVSDAQALKAARPASTLVLVKGMSHVLKAADKMSLEQQSTTVYADPSLPIEPAVPKAIIAASRSS